MGFNSPPLGGCFLTPSPSGDSADVPFLLYLLSSTFLFLFSLPFPSPLPSSLSVFLRWKAGSSRQPFVTVPYLNCFHGFPFRSIHTNGGVPPLLPCLHSFSLSLSLSTDLNYPKGCFDEGFSIFSFHPLLPSPRPSPVYRRETLHILGPLAPNLLVHLVLAQSDLSRAPDTFSYIFFPFFFFGDISLKPIPW